MAKPYSWGIGNVESRVNLLHLAARPVRTTYRDLYASTPWVLPEIYARMSPDAIGMLSVYYDPTAHAREGNAATHASPDVKRAADELFADKPEHTSVLYANEYSNRHFRKL